jgi:energy-converting hydrogenase Eha subunit G
MAPNRLKALGIPTAVNVACALFVLAAFHMDQSVALQLTGLVARLLIVVAFCYFVQAWRKTVLAYW